MCLSDLWSNFIFVELKCLLLGHLIISVVSCLTWVHLFQVELLLNYLVNDPRREVQYCVLQCLYLLAKHGAHLWPETSVTSLVNVARGPHPRLVICALDVLVVLTHSTAVCNAHIQSGNLKYFICSKTLIIPANCGWT